MNVQEFITKAINFPVEVLDSYSHNRGLSGQFFASGKIYDYRVDSNSIRYVQNDLDNSYLEGYIDAKIQQLGLSTDSDNLYEYLQGALFDPNERMDDKCVTGVPCNGRCLPRGSKCGLGDKLKGALSGLSNKVKSVNPPNPELQKLERKRLGHQNIVDRGLAKHTALSAGLGAGTGALVGGPGGALVLGLAGASLGSAEHGYSTRRVREIDQKIKKLKKK